MAGEPEVTNKSFTLCLLDGKEFFPYVCGGYYSLYTSKFEIKYAHDLFLLHRGQDGYKIGLIPQLQQAIVQPVDHVPTKIQYLRL